MRALLVVAVLLVLAVVLTGCAGTSTDPSGTWPARGVTIVSSPTLDEVRASYAELGKEMPAFLESAQDPAEVSVQNLMTNLVFGYYSAYSNVARGRVSWFEQNCTSASYPTDVSCQVTSGDPDLFVFTPFRYSTNQMSLIGYSNGYGDEHVGSFYPSSWGGRGRFIAAVYGYGSGTNRFRVGFY